MRVQPVVAHADAQADGDPVEEHGDGTRFVQLKGPEGGDGLDVKTRSARAQVR